MNLVLDDAEEVHMKTKNRKPLGKNELHIFTFVCYLLTALCLTYKHAGHIRQRGEFLTQFKYFSCCNPPIVFVSYSNLYLLTVSDNAQRFLRRCHTVFENAAVKGNVCVFTVLLSTRDVNVWVSRFDSDS